jgi:hypothetical protein
VGWEHDEEVTKPGFVPRDGGVKIVFDVPETVVDDAVSAVRAAGFDVHRYYHPGDEHRPGGSAPGHVRLGAQRAMHEFTQAEQDAVVAAFDDVEARAGFACSRVGVDAWTSGNHDGPAGVREPRRPKPVAGKGAARLV